MAWGRVDPDALSRNDAAADPVGGRVERTGIALVRRGEHVMPDGDGAATLAPARRGALGEGTFAAVDAGLAQIVLEIPITVEIGPSAAEITKAAAELALRRLSEALDARAIS